MTQKSYAVNIATILGVSVVLMLFIFILVTHHRGIPDRVRLDSSALRSTASSAAERIKPAGQVSVPSADTRREPAKKTVAAPPPNRDGK